MEQPVVLYKLRPIEPIIFHVDRPTITMIGRVDDLFMNVGLDLIPTEQLQPVQLEMRALTLRKLIDWCNHHKFDAPYDEDVADTQELSVWDTNFFMVRHSLLFDLMRAARDYHVPAMFAMCCRVIRRNPREIYAGMLDDTDDEDNAVQDVRRIRYVAAA